MIAIFKLSMLFFSAVIVAVIWGVVGCVERCKWDIGWMQMVAALYRVIAFGFVVWLVLWFGWFMMVCLHGGVVMVYIYGVGFIAIAFGVIGLILLLGEAVVLFKNRSK